MYEVGFKSALSSFDLINVFLLGQSLVTNFGALEFAQLDLTPVLRISNLVSVGIITLVQVGIHGFLLKVFYRLCFFFFVWNQLFFTYRLYKLSSFRVIPSIATTFCLIRLTCYTADTVHKIIHHEGPKTTAWTWSLLSVGILTIISDLLVVGGLSYSLWKRRLLWKAHSDNVSWYYYDTIFSARSYR